MIKLKAMSETMMKVSNKNMDYMNTRGSQRDYYPHFTIDECIQGMTSITSTIISDTRDIGNRSAINAMNEAFSGDKDKVRIIQEGAMENIKEKVKSFFQKIWGFITSIISKIKDFFKRKLDDQKDKEPVDKVFKEYAQDLNKAANSAISEVKKEAEEGTLKDIKVEVKDEESGEVEELVIPKEVVKENPEIVKELIEHKIDELENFKWKSRPWTSEIIRSVRDMEMWYKESQIGKIEKIFKDLSRSNKPEEELTVTIKTYAEEIKEISTGFITKMKEMISEKPVVIDTRRLSLEDIARGIEVLTEAYDTDEFIMFLKNEVDDFINTIYIATKPGFYDPGMAKEMTERLNTFKSFYIIVITMWQWYCRLAYAIYSDCDRARNKILRMRGDLRDFGHNRFKYLVDNGSKGKEIIKRFKAKVALSGEERYKEMTKNVK